MEANEEQIGVHEYWAPAEDANTGETFGELTKLALLSRIMNLSERVERLEEKFANLTFDEHEQAERWATQVTTANANPEGMMSKEYAAGYERGKADAYHELGEENLPEGYVHIHAQLWEDTKLELQKVTIERNGLRAFKESVPWDDLGVLLMDTAGIDGLYDFRKVVVDWANNNRPEATE